MSLLHQDKTGASNGVLDPMQFQHQQLLSQFQKNVSYVTIHGIYTYFQENKKEKMSGMEHLATLCVLDRCLIRLNINIF